MAVIHPIQINGSWVSGFALDYHTISSSCIGHDAFGHPMFETEYTELGGLLYRLKSQKDKSVVGGIVETIAQFVEGTWKPRISMIVPVPPSNVRAEQPVIILVDALGERLKVPVQHGGVAKTQKTEQLKNISDYTERMRILERAFTSDPSIVSEQRVLLFDDLYRSGATMNSITTVLREQGKAAEVNVLAVTRTRVNR